ncbi:MAG: PRC-barrel domain-containing protein [Sphingomonadaceae bacterium]
MDIAAHLEHDHAELRTLGDEVLKSPDSDGPGGRDNQFALFSKQLRRHLAVVEDVLFAELTDERRGTAKADHKRLRKSLSRLDRKDKGSDEWTAGFRALLGDMESVLSAHDSFRAAAGGRNAGELGERYEEAKLKRMRGLWNWNRVGIGVGAAAAVAGVAGATYAGARKLGLVGGEGGASRDGGEDDFQLRLETDENLRLISSKKVEGTPVVNRDGEHLGRIDAVMIDKYTGRVAYAIMSFGGLFGLGSSLFPLPWPLLDYEEEQDGYVLDISKEELKDAPRFEPNDAPEFDPDYRRRVILFYRPR